ncbi:MAG: hypothetical protein F6K39_02560 [Okeania sp. SIO3B3]|nr:hypothetical protein [Okeania sp. SIO3B3]
MLVEDALNLTIEELYEHIGRDTTTKFGGNIGLGETDPQEYQNRGLRWLNKHRQNLKKAICNSYIAEIALHKERTRDQALLIAAIADILVSLSLGVSPVVVAALLVKEGVTQLCLEES